MNIIEHSALASDEVAEKFAQTVRANLKSAAFDTIRACLTALLKNDDPLPLDELRRMAFDAALAYHHGNVTEACRKVGIGRSTAYRDYRDLIAQHGGKPA